MAGVPWDGLRERCGSVPYFLGFFRTLFFSALAWAFAFSLAFWAVFGAVAELAYLAGWKHHDLG